MSYLIACIQYNLTESIVILYKYTCAFQIILFILLWKVCTSDVNSPLQNVQLISVI